MSASVDASVIVPVYDGLPVCDDPVGVGTTLRALAAQTPPANGNEVVETVDPFEDGLRCSGRYSIGDVGTP
jgi:hypothetical protein